MPIQTEQYSKITDSTDLYKPISLLNAGPTCYDATTHPYSAPRSHIVHLYLLDGTQETGGNAEFRILVLVCLQNVPLHHLGVVDKL